MKRQPGGILAVVIILLSTQFIHAESKAITNCNNVNAISLPDNWTLEQQSCIRIDLGELEPSKTFDFEISSNNEIDIILFPANSLEVYLNEQSYRNEMIWQQESVFENFNGDGEWHWTVPDDREKTRWYMIIDNFDHPGDDGMGAQGELEVQVSFDMQEITTQPYTLFDSIIRVDTSSFSIAEGPIVVDTGTKINVFARTMEGNPDIFIMTEEQKNLYSDGGTAASRIIEADLLLVSNEMYKQWLVPEAYEGVDLYVIVDNRAGPGGGGAGTTIAKTTITITLDPIINPVISTLNPQQTYDVGELISFSALDTPNRSNQISDSGYSWDVNQDDIPDFFGPILDYMWPNPDNASLKLNVISTDGTMVSTILPLQIEDNTPPNASISVNGDLQKGYNQTILISALFSDNWDVESTEWLVDGIIEQSNASIGDAFSSSFTFSFDSNYQAGEHNIEFIVTDKSGQKSSDSVKVILSDLSPPIFDNYVNQISVSVGEPITFEISAYDEESDEIQYSWIFNEGMEDETQLYGRLIQYDFQTTGAQRVLCIAENNAGLSSQAEIIVTVEESEAEEKSLNPFFILIILILFLIIISIIAYILFRRRILIRAKELSQKKEEPVEEIKPPSAEEQKQMWAQTSPNLYMSDSNPIVDIADVDLEELLEDAQKPPSTSFTSEDSLLSDLIDDVPDPQVSKTVNEKISDRVIKKNCSSCNLLFSVELPEGIDSARTACPKCGSIEEVNLV
ncbi:MAG: hypothetical protein ACJZ4Z_05460 [Candidatus Thalassarchaeaceae archaeon]